MDFDDNDIEFLCEQLAGIFFFLLFFIPGPWLTGINNDNWDVLCIASCIFLCVINEDSFESSEGFWTSIVAGIGLAYFAVWTLQWIMSA